MIFFGVGDFQAGGGNPSFVIKRVEQANAYLDSFICNVT